MAKFSTTRLVRENGPLLLALALSAVFWLITSLSKETFYQNEQVPPALRVGGIAAILFFGVILQVILRSLSQSRADLRDELGFFSTIFAEGPTPGLVIDGESGKIIDANQAASRLYGWSIESLRQKNMMDLAVVNEEAVKNRLLEISQHRSLRFRTKNYLQSGRICPVEIDATFLDLSSRKTLVCLVRDLSTEEEVQRSLEEQRLITESLFESARVGYWDWNLTTQRVYLSQQLLQMIGISENSEKPLPANWEDLVMEQDLPKMMSEYQSHIDSRGEYPFFCEIRYHQKSGNPIWMICTGKVIEWDTDDQPVRMVGCNIDISERKTNEQHLFLANRALNSIRAGVTISRAANDYPIRYINRSFENLTGYTHDEVIGKNCRFLLRDDYDQEALTTVRKALREKTNCQVVLRNYRKDGSLFWNRLTISPVFDHNGELTHFVGTQEDVSKEIAAQQELVLAKESAERANHVRDEFLAMMSHELRTPLNPIIGLGTFLLDETDDPDKKDMLKTIVESGYRQLGLVENLLSISDLASMRPTERQQSLDIQDLLDAVIATNHRKLKPGVKIQTDMDHCDPEVWIRGTEKHLEQMLDHLVENACKFSEHGVITLRAYTDRPTQENRNLYFEIQDQGVGISEDALERIFRPFEQEDSSSKRKFQGAGLGLAIAKKIALILGGDITVSSEVGAGSRFLCRIPLIEKPTDVAPLPEPIQPKPRPNSAETGRPTILIVEDQESNAFFVQSFLKRKEMSTILAVDGEMAVAEFAKNDCSAIILDLHIPVLDGYEVLKRIRATEKGENTPVIVVTADVNPEIPVRCRELGVTACLTKPFDIKEFYKILQDSLGERPDQSETPEPSRSQLKE
ncbi:hybrid sensor histidine kinase/response regulator [Puniceicoccus vermicola]|uniref:histidine kinase n=1 Tax=Puniceicoccus vermicola TaxID=388746 RepID=A0A7X1AWC4_9BACT|nr:PAS domain S-box protein [Puniceicoccus vermicola]MBC2600283.1 PAS domain S-box protein [Puniceicoccus vermicola]